MDYYQTFEGIVLSKRKYREQDALIKIFTKEKGKYMFFVKHLSAQHPLAAVTLPISRASYLGHLSSDSLSFLKDAKDSTIFASIQEDIERESVATYMIHLVDAVIEDRVPCPDLYELLSQSLDALQDGKHPRILMHLFEIKMLSFFGIYITWDQCVRTGNKQGIFDFSMIFQGVLAESSFEEDPHRLHISPKAVQILRILSQLTSPSQLGDIKVSDDTLKEMKRLMDAIYKEFVGIHLKSKSFIDQMEQWSDLAIKRRTSDVKRT